MKTCALFWFHQGHLRFANQCLHPFITKGTCIQLFFWTGPLQVIIGEKQHPEKKIILGGTVALQKKHSVQENPSLWLTIIFLFLCDHDICLLIKVFGVLLLDTVARSDFRLKWYCLFLVFKAISTILAVNLLLRCFQLFAVCQNLVC